MKHSTIVPFAAVLATLSLVGLGCNPTASIEKSAGNAVANSLLGAASGGKVSVNSDSNAVQFKDSKTGTSVAYGDNLKLPDNFPKDVPLPSDITINSTTVDPSGKSASVMFDSKQDLQAVVSFYKDKLTGAGFTEGQSVSAGNTETRDYTKGNIRISFIASADSQGGVTTVNIVREETKDSNAQ